jgi:hypothetical protein
MISIYSGSLKERSGLANASEDAEVDASFERKWRHATGATPAETQSAPLQPASPDRPHSNGYASLVVTTEAWRDDADNEEETSDNVEIDAWRRLHSNDSLGFQTSCCRVKKKVKKLESLFEALAQGSMEHLSILDL